MKKFYSWQQIKEENIITLKGANPLLVSSEHLLERIAVTIESVILTKEGKHAFIVLENFIKTNYQNDNLQRPEIMISEPEKAVVVYCNDELFAYVNQLRGKDFESVNAVTLIKMWSQLKKMFEPKSNQPKGEMSNDKET